MLHAFSIKFKEPCMSLVYNLQLYKISNIELSLNFYFIDDAVSLSFSRNKILFIYIQQMVRFAQSTFRNIK